MDGNILDLAKGLVGKDGSGGNTLLGFDMWGLFAAIVFGIIGITYVRLGKKNAEFSTAFAGIALMAFPYFVSNTLHIVLIGIALCFAPSFIRKFL